MKTALVFDIDNTLTPPREPINQEMTDILSRLNIPFFVAAGTHYPLLEDQFFKPLYDCGFRGQFEAYVSNGAVRFRCNYSDSISVELISEFKMKECLGENDFNFLAKSLEEVLELEEFKLPSEIKIFDARAADRGSMFNLCPIGRMLDKNNDNANKEYFASREKFAQFDRMSGYRKKVIEHLNHKLSALVKNKGLKIMLGGQTSFDIGIKGEDKTKPIRTLLDDGFERVIFIGDALFEGGNDAVINEFIESWPPESKCPVESIQINSWRETLAILQKLGFVNQRGEKTKMEIHGIKPYEKEWYKINLTDELVASYSLDKWSENFSLMTAGYRDQLNPDNADDPNVGFNSITVSILGEAKARVFNRKLKSGEQAHIHIGGETRPHTQDFIAILSRIYAAHNITVHLRAYVKTTPIWYSSFGIFYKGYQSGDNLTASHSPFFKGGWKPMDSAGKQLLEEEQEIIAEVKNIIKNRESISLAPWEAKNIIGDFDVDEPYVKYQNSVIAEKSKNDIKQAIKNGFCCAICTVGGSMKATTERLFPMLNIPVELNGAIQYLFGEEDEKYHFLGERDGKHFGPDPSKQEVYKNIGAQEILLNNKANIVFIWDPDGDRFNIVTLASAEEAKLAKMLGLEIEAFSDSDKAIIYFTPNQLFFMLTAYRIGALKKSGLLSAYDWFIAPSISTSRSISEIAAKENIPVTQVRVGFKYMGTLSEWLENRADPNMPFINAVGDEIRLGEKPRALIMCEESGGAVFGGAELLMNEKGSKGLIALREKDGMQFGMMALSLASHLFNSNQSFADYYCELIKEYDIKNKFFNRKDVKLYDESLTGSEREKAKAAGINKRDAVMNFFKNLAALASAGKSMEKIHGVIISKLADGNQPLPKLKRIRNVGEGKLLEGTLMEFEDFWFLIRASGTDALLRYYIEGKNKDEIIACQQSLINLKI